MTRERVLGTESEIPESERDIFGRRPKNRPDWSHRRREPRGLALVWTVYLMLATMVALMPMVASGQLSPDVYRPAARLMMLFVMVGLAVLWPVLRLSQRPHRESPVSDVARDLGVMCIPAFVIVWPQIILAGWPIAVVLAVCAVLLVWGVTSGIILLWWHRYSRGGWAGRAIAVLAVTLLSGGIPLGLLLLGGLDLSRPGPEAMTGWMWSPHTAVWEVLRARVFSGQPALVGVSHWRILGAQAVLASMAFIASALCCRGSMAGDNAAGYAPSEPG